MVTYCPRYGRCVQSPRGSDASKPARRAAADDALRCDEASEVARGGRSRGEQAAWAREIALPESGSDPTGSRPLGEQVRRTLGCRTERTQAQTGENDGKSFRNLHQDDTRASLARNNGHRDAAQIQLWSSRHFGLDAGLALRGPRQRKPDL